MIRVLQSVTVNNGTTAPATVGDECSCPHLEPITDYVCKAGLVGVRPENLLYIRSAKVECRATIAVDT
jgi:hypothetical protein